MLILKRRQREKNRQRELFQNRADILHSLGPHRHLVQVCATYSTETRLGILMSPLADSGDLNSFLADLQSYHEDSPDIQTERIHNMIRILKTGLGCLASGLFFLHRKRIRHKDTKAHNILVHRGRLLYTDFGLSLDSTQSDNSTTEGPTDMSRRYAAPEVIKGQPRNSSSDVFSLGCVFIEIFFAINNVLLHDHQELFAHAVASIHTKLVPRGVPKERKERKEREERIFLHGSS
jgi:serine/threonine protein kinase